MVNFSKARKSERNRMEGNGLTKKIAGTNTLRLGIALSLLLVLPIMHAAASAAWSSNGPGTFSSTTCTLSGTGATATCNVTFTSLPGKPSVETITGTYGGDANHYGSVGSTTITHK